MPRLPSAPVAEGVVIRPERDADHPVIAEVVRAAFVGHPDEVASFVERIRASEQFIPELALVAEDSSGVIAHVMLSWVGVEGGSRTRILNLTPMSVRPDRQRIGVGTRLIRDALGRAEAAGEPAVMVEGIAAYYPRFGFERARGRDIVSSQFNFDQADLAYIRNHYIFLDHDQRWTGSGGIAYRFDNGALAGTKVAADLIYGSGLRQTPDGAAPNSGQLPGYVQVNASISHRFQTAGLELRFDVINIFDSKYEIRSGTGVGVGAPSWGPRRGFFAGITKEF